MAFSHSTDDRYFEDYAVRQLLIQSEIIRINDRLLVIAFQHRIDVLIFAK